MELDHLFLFMFENDRIVPTAGKSRLILDDLALEVIDHPVANSKMRGPDDIAQEIEAIVNRSQPAGIPVQLQPQACGKKFPNSKLPILQFPDIIAQQHQIIDITQIISAFQCMLHELVKLVQIDIGEKLAGIVADGQTGAPSRVEKGLVAGYLFKQIMSPLFDRVFGRIVEDDDAHEPDDLRPFFPTADNVVEDLLVDGHEKRPDVQVHEKCVAGAVVARLAHKFLESSYSRVISLAFAAGIAVVDEAPFPSGLQVPDEEVMDDAVAEMGGEDLPGFRALRDKAGRRKGAVGAGFQLLLQFDEVSLGLELKLQGATAAAFALAAVHVRPIKVSQ